MAYRRVPSYHTALYGGLFFPALMLAYGSWRFVETRYCHA